MSLEVSVLGPLVVRRDGAVVDLGGPKQRAVLALLLASAPEAVPVAELVEEVWGDAGPADPSRSVQVYVSALRHALGGAGMIEAGPAGYRLPEPVTDAETFRREAAEAVDLARTGCHVEAARLAARGLARWSGPAWQDQRHLRRVASAAHLLDQLRVDLEEVELRSAVAAGHHREVITALEDLVARNPLREGPRELLMLALHRAGRRTDALAVYDETRRVLVEETGLDPSSCLQQLQARVLADDPALRVEDADVRARRHLPAPLTALVGRGEEAQLLRAAMASHRLVSVTGPGGIGKTRLALRVAHDAASTGFTDGVWFVDLQSVTDPATVAEAIARSVGIEAPDDVVAALHSWAGERSALLLLDNFEQVVDAGPVVSELLAGAPGLHVLVTSRVRLHVYGEHVHPVGPLAAADAVTLFVERAQDVATGVDLGDAALVALLCESLDRLPLAIELVAARSDEIGVREMLAQLDQRLALASSGPRDRPARQRSLREAVAWSVELLPGSASRSFGRLSVFAGGFTAEAASGFADADDVAVLERANLVVREGARHRMLETIRSYAEEHAGAGLVGAREQHATWALDLADQAATGLLANHQRWVGVLAAETGNLRAALRHLADTADTDRPPGLRLLRLAADLTSFWYRTSPGSEDLQWLERALEAAPGADPVLRARAHYGLAICAGERGDSDVALVEGHRALNLLTPGLDDVWRARALNTVAGVTLDLGHVAEALPILEESLAVRRHLASPSLTLLAPLLNLAMAALHQGRTAQADEALAEAYRVARDDVERCYVAQWQASVALADGDVDRAAAMLVGVVEALRQGGETFRLIEALDQLAGVAALRGEAHETAVLLAAADAANRAENLTLVPVDEQLRRARTAGALDTLGAQALAVARLEGSELDLDAALDRGLALCRSPWVR